MRQETKFMIEMVANHRMDMIRKKDPTSKVGFTWDDSGLRGSVQMSVGGELRSIEFIESETTAGKIDLMEDYELVVNELGSLTIMYPEAKYPREMAHPIYQSIVKEVKQRTGKDFIFTGFVYDALGNLKKVG